MSEKLQQAIDATRAGQKRDAQFLLTEALAENPNDEHAWFLLGNLVDSPEKRKAYLGKALAINPQYEKAKQQYAQVQQLVMTVPEMGQDDDFAEEPSTLPDWLEDEFDSDSVAETSTAADTIENMDIVVAGDESKTDIVPVKTAVTPTTTSASTNREQQLRRYNYMLAFIVLLIIVVLIFLATSI